jgi:E3 ubiquitin-protein ligase mind-bomb
VFLLSLTATLRVTSLHSEDDKAVPSSSRETEIAAARETNENASNLDDHQSVGAQSESVECVICSEVAGDNLVFEPCGHRIACEECSSRMKKCIKCGTVIAKRVTHGALPIG